MKKKVLYMVSSGLIATGAMWNVCMSGPAMTAVAAESAEEIVIEGAFSADGVVADDGGSSADAGAGDILDADGTDVTDAGENNTTANTVSDEHSSVNLSIHDQSVTVMQEEINPVNVDEFIFPVVSGDMYVIRFSAEKEKAYSLYLSEEIKDEDLFFLYYDAANKVAKDPVGEGEFTEASDGTFRIRTEKDTVYMIVVEHAERYPDLGVSVVADETDQALPEESETVIEQTIPIKTEAGTEQMIPAEAETGTEQTLPVETGAETELPLSEENETESEPEPEQDLPEESESETELTIPEENEIESEPEQDLPEESESETELTIPEETETESDTEQSLPEETETEQTVPSGTEDETSLVSLESISLVLDEGLEEVPSSMLFCLEDQNVAKAMLHYSDGSEQLLTEGSDDYGNTVQMAYEDSASEDGSVSRTYTVKVSDAAGAELEDTETVVFGPDGGSDIDGIKAQEKTKVGCSGKVNWLLIRTVPEVTGKYSMQSFGRKVEELYYLADGTSDVQKADSSFELEKGVTYTFLLKLE